MVSEKTKISATEADWSREKLRKWWSPSKQLIKSIRQYQKHQKNPQLFSSIWKKWHVLEHRFWTVMAGADIPINCQLGGGLVMPHPTGVVINSQAKIGVNCLILQQVTIVKDVTIGGHIDIGAGAKILNSVTIGDNAKIGANAVVVPDVPADKTAVGVPAKVLNK